MGRELTFRAVLVRRVAGASRGVYEQTLMATRDSWATGLMLSGAQTVGR